MAGSYIAAEELFVIEGEFTMSGETYVAGDWAYFPRNWLRDGTSSPGGMLALARFDGPARWTRDTGNTEGAMRAHLSPGTLDEPVEGALGHGWPLRDSIAEQAWYLTALASGMPSPHDIEIFEIDSKRWTFVEAQSWLPPVSGPVFARAFPRV